MALLATRIDISEATYLLIGVSIALARLSRRSSCCSALASSPAAPLSSRRDVLVSRSTQKLA